MNTKYFKLLIFIAVCLFSSCDENSFQKDIVIDLPDHEPKLAMSSHVIIGSNSLHVYVNSSVGVLKNEEVEGIKDAIVQVYIDGNLRYELPYLYDPISSFNYPEGTYGLLNIPTNELEIGNYEIRVSAPGFDPIKAQQFAPAPIQLLEAEYVESDVEEVEDQVNYKFLDPAGEKNYYAFDAYLLTTFNSGSTFNQHVYYDIDDELVASYSEIGPIISDDAFDGQIKQIAFNTSLNEPGTFNIQSQVLRVILRTITEDKFRFFRSLEIYQESKDNPFAEPVIIHDNVEAGYGVFSLESRDTIEIVIQ